MQVVLSVKDMQDLASSYKRRGQKIGFVPTMGYLHEGHLSLIRIAKKMSDVCVVSIFVNPLQFGPNEDFNEYPRDLMRDKELLEKEGVDILFLPDEREMYPIDFCTFVEVEGLSDVLCGKYRPGHFRGVTTVVAKLFNIVKPDIAVFGEKDAQQAIIIKRMVRDLNFDVKIVTAPTVREEDGLAMSSRNTYLTPEQRKEAPVLYKSLLLARKLIEQGERDPEKIKKEMEKMIKENANCEIQYIEIVRKEDLKPLDRIEGEVLIALAAKFGRARLIDNITVKVNQEKGR